MSKILPLLFFYKDGFKDHQMSIDICGYDLIQIRISTLYQTLFNVTDCVHNSIADTNSKQVSTYLLLPHFCHISTTVRLHHLDFNETLEE